jgi:hypothetical protein
VNPAVGQLPHPARREPDTGDHRALLSPAMSSTRPIMVAGTIDRNRKRGKADWWSPIGGATGASASPRTCDQRIASRAAIRISRNRTLI